LGRIVSENDTRGCSSGNGELASVTVYYTALLSLVLLVNGVALLDKFSDKSILVGGRSKIEYAALTCLIAVVELVPSGHHL
jgi:hypothetical protein